MGALTAKVGGRPKASPLDRRITTPQAREKWCGEGELNPLRSLLVSTHIHTTLISRSGWNFFSPELRRNAIPHQTHANTEVKKAIEFFINTSITKPKTKTEAKISNPNEITMLTSMCTHTSKSLKKLT